MARLAKTQTETDISKVLAEALRRTTISPTIFGYRPQEYQQVFHNSTSHGRLFLGGNRAGKTVAGAAEAVMRLTGNHPVKKYDRPIKLRGVGVDFDNGIDKIMLPEIARWIPPSALIKGSWTESYSKSARTLTLNNDSTMEFMSYDQDVDKFAGTSRDGVWFDEEPPEEIFNENMLRLVDVEGDWWLTMTPLIDMSWTLDRLYEPGQSGLNKNIQVFRAKTTDNKFISEAAMDILTMGMSEEQTMARKEGLYSSYTGAIYTEVLSGRFIDPIIDSIDESLWEGLYKNWSHFGMLDHGLANPTAFYLGAVNEEGVVIIYKEYYKAKRVVKENAQAILSIIAELKLQEKLQYIVADPSIRNTDPINGSSVLAEYGKEGLYLSLANNDVSAGINRVFSRFKTGHLYVTKDCEKLIWELQRYRWAKFASPKLAAKNNLKETPLKKDDHGCDAIRYGLASCPAIYGEADMRETLIIQSSVALPSSGHLVDSELVSAVPYKSSRAFVDSTLGDDW